MFSDVICNIKMKQGHREAQLFSSPCTFYLQFKKFTFSPVQQIKCNDLHHRLRNLKLRHPIMAIANCNPYESVHTSKIMKGEKKSACPPAYMMKYSELEEHPVRCYENY